MSKKQWWRHDWEPVEPESLISHETRKCKDCGARQQYTEDTWYMRITGWSWGPKVSQRCPEAKKDNLS